MGFFDAFYFLDPNLKNISYVPNDDYILPAKVKDYEEFKNKILSKIKGEIDNKILVNKEKFCYPSNEVSKKILNTLRVLEEDIEIKSSYEKNKVF